MKKKYKLKEVPHPQKSSGWYICTQACANPVLHQWLLWLCMMLYAVVLARTAWLCDDAYITFRTVDNFINGFGLRWNIAERVQSYTHPLWMLLLSLCSFFTRELYLTPILLSMVVSFSAVAILARRAGGAAISAALGVFILVLSKAFVDYSTSGLENPLTYLILVFFFISFVKGSYDGRHLFRLSALACLGVLNRMDTGLFFAPVLIYGLLRYKRIKGVGIVLAGFAPFFLWEIFSLIYYGYLVPNTAFAKMSTGISRGEYLAQGVSYFKNSVANDPLTLVVIAYSLVMVCIKRAWRYCLPMAGVVLYLVYIVWIGGDFMSGRFFAAPLLIAVAVLVSSDFFIRRRYLAVAAIIAAVMGFSIPTATLLSGSDYGINPKNFFDVKGIANERTFYFWNTGLINTAALKEKPRGDVIGLAARARQQKTPVSIRGAVGFSGFFLGASVYVIDYHGLCDPLLSHLPMVSEDPSYKAFYEKILGKECKDKWRIGHFLRNIPYGYVSSVISAENILEDENLRGFYEKIRIITRGDLFTCERLKAIAGMNLDLYDHLLVKEREPFKKNTLECLEIFDKYSQICCPTIVENAAEEAYLHKDYGKTVSCLELLVSLEPKEHRHWTNLARGYYLLNNYEKAEQTLTVALDVLGNQPDIMIRLAFIKKEIGKQDEANALAREAARRGDPEAIRYLQEDSLEQAE